MIFLNGVRISVNQKINEVKISPQSYIKKISDGLKFIMKQKPQEARRNVGKYL